MSAQGQDLSESDYLTQIEDNNNKIKEYESERLQAYEDYLKALANSDGVYGGETADDWLAKYNQLGTDINNLKVDNEDLKKSLRDDVYWRAFERAHNAAQQLQNILSGISSLLSDDMYYDSDGNLTEYGISNIANLVSQYESAREEVQNYSNDIENLNNLYEQGCYTQEEYTSKLNEFQTGLLDSAASMKSYINEIADMYKSLAQSELDSLFELIDARNDALSAKKEYYDYDKSIKSKTKDIQSLQAQIAALENVETAEAKAKNAKLKAQLAESQDDLNDTINEHMLTLSQDALNSLKDTLQDAFDDKWDNISSNLEEIAELMSAANNLTSAQSYTINSALNKLLDFYGIDPVSTGIDSYVGFASGTKGVDRDRFAWTNENGQEIIVQKSDGAILTPLSKGDSVIPNDLSSNLFDWGKLNPQVFTNSISKMPKANINTPTTTVVQHYDNLLNVEGNVDSTVISDVKGFASQFYKGSYEYTVKEIAKDARKMGIKV